MVTIIRIMGNFLKCIFILFNDAILSEELSIHVTLKKAEREIMRGV
jgi:hypothetical protein